MIDAISSTLLKGIFPFNISDIDGWDIPISPLLSLRIFDATEEIVNPCRLMAVFNLSFIVIEYLL